ncbi:MAG: NAD(P)-dependent oxidoreductase [Peptoniphilaceae bacterium]|nr:NAD(P)-dependent oxidoreductase [Peptoniphilaceae bacterium]MDY6019502.1 NAD(P)-dependent oxidoreductase [Anaerococcus sp.]
MKVSLIDPLTVDDDIIIKHKEKIESLGHDFEYFKESASSDQEIIERLKDTDVAIITNKKLTGNVIKNTNLKLLDVAFTGVDHIDLEACKEKGIIVENASGYSDDSVAELVIGLAIGLLRKFDKNYENMYQVKNNFLLGGLLRDKKVGVIGTGKIGIKTIELLKAFGCQIIANSRTEKEDVKAMGVSYVDIETLMKESDIITLHIPNNKQTKGFIDKEKLDMMKEGAILINCARGPIVDNAYLAELLNQDKIRAGIDVFDMEPPIPEDYPLRNAKNCILTNHVAFFTKEAMEIRAEIVFNNLYKYFDGEIVNQVEL